MTAYSTALFSTWYFVEELGILFDAGDGVIAGLLQKSRKVKHVFISHADRDHLTGLMQFNQLNAEFCPNIYYPKDCASFPFLEEFLNKFDHLNKGTKWIPICVGDKIPIKNDLYVEALRNSHVAAAEGVSKSLSYKVIQRKWKLKPEFESFSGIEIKNLREKHGVEGTSNEVLTNIISYSGDTPVEDEKRFFDTKVLIHEATFLAKGDAVEKPHKNKHSTLEEVMEMLSKTKVEKAILGHFSSRYSHDTIIEAVAASKKKFNISIPIYLVLPGEIAKHVI